MSGFITRKRATSFHCKQTLSKLKQSKGKRPTMVRGRTLSLPDCIEMARIQTDGNTTKPAPRSTQNGTRATRPRSVSCPPEVLLFVAVAENDVAELRRILDEHDEVDINQQSPSGLTALHYAAAEGSLECLQELVARGVLLDVHDSQGCSPLDFAARSFYFDCAALLVRAGAQIGNIIHGVK